MVGRIKQPIASEVRSEKYGTGVLARPRGNPLANFLSSLGFPPISLWELQEARRRLKDKGRLVVDEPA
jgi:hypothetical protein